MTFVRPRLTDNYGIPLLQAEVDFAIPFVDEDLPLYVDPFLLWKSPSQQDNALHTQIVSTFNRLGGMFLKGKEQDSTDVLVQISECNEVGLGLSKTRAGKKISIDAALAILRLYKHIPQIQKDGFHHIEEIQLMVDTISKDRISDFSCSLIKSFLVDYTIDQCNKLDIPLFEQEIMIFEHKEMTFVKEIVPLPLNPGNSLPVLFVPKRWLKYLPWINYDDYYKNCYFKDPSNQKSKRERIQILNYNRDNYGVIEAYTLKRECDKMACHNDPLFTQIPILSAKRDLSSVLKTPSGSKDKADKFYEKSMVKLLSSMLYPHLDFAQDQCRTDSGSQIRDIIFYNNRSYDFLQDIYSQYQTKQLVVELKNVKSIEREHINQLNRYLAEQFGKFGIIFTRNPISTAMFRNTIDLWSGQRRCILVLDDEDLKQMCQVYESKQRNPIDVLKKKYVEFTRECPG